MRQREDAIAQRAQDLAEAAVRTGDLGPGLRPTADQALRC